MYFHEIQEALSNGQKVKRNGWPKGTHLVTLPQSDIDLSEDEFSRSGLKEGAKVETDGDVFLLVQPENRGIYGYKLTSEDRQLQDWEILKK